jgi:hypothetical protein
MTLNYKILNEFHVPSSTKTISELLKHFVNCNRNLEIFIVDEYNCTLWGLIELDSALKIWNLTNKFYAKHPFPPEKSEIIAQVIFRDLNYGAYVHIKEKNSDKYILEDVCWVDKHA